MIRPLARAAVIAGVALGAAGIYVAVRSPGGRTAALTQPVHPLPRAVATSGAAIPTKVATVAAASAGSMVTGEIRFEGDAPPPRLINFGPNVGCAERHHEPMYDDSLVVNLDSTLQNVVVSVVAGPPRERPFAAPAQPVYLDQSGCSYQPHVLAMMTGQKVVVRNSDPVLHNTRSLAVRNREFNIAQPQADSASSVPSPDEPEIFQVRCDIHPWMSSWFCVFSNPYFDVSGANGTFTLRDLPPGTYRLRAWHEKLGTVERDVVLRAGHDETINFVFRASAPPPKQVYDSSQKHAANDRSASTPIS